MQILKQCLSFFRFRRQVCRSPPQPEADLLNVIWDISGESISTECYLGLFWGNHFEEPKYGPFWGNHFQKPISGTILGKPFQRIKIWTILGKPFLKTKIWDHSRTNFQPHYHTQAPVVKQNLEPFLGMKS